MESQESFPPPVAPVVSTDSPLLRLRPCFKGVDPGFTNIHGSARRSSLNVLYPLGNQFNQQSRPFHYRINISIGALGDMANPADILQQSFFTDIRGSVHLNPGDMLLHQGTYQEISFPVRIEVGSYQ